MDVRLVPPDGQRRRQSLETEGLAGRARGLDHAVGVEHQSVSPGSIRASCALNSSSRRIPRGRLPFPSSRISPPTRRSSGKGWPAQTKRSLPDSGSSTPQNSVMKARRPPGPTECPIDHPRHRDGVRVEVEPELEGRARDRHQQPGRDAVAAGVARDHGPPSVVEGKEVVVIAANGVGGAVGEGEGIAIDLGRLNRQELPLQLPSHLELVPHHHPVGELEHQQKHQPGDAEQRQETDLQAR